MSKKLVIKTIVRTLVYQLLLLWAGFSVGFMLNPEYWGNRAPIVHQSMRNIFWPIEYNEKVEKFLLEVGRSRIFFSLDEDCKSLRILEDRMDSDEWYAAKYEFIDSNGQLVTVDNYRTKINWKPWEYDYPPPNQKIANSIEDFE